MTPTLLVLTLFVGLDDSSPRKPNPLAPSLPLLTEEEEERLDGQIDRFIKADLGQLPVNQSRQAVIEFQRIGPEGIPALIRGLNRAAAIEGSCPAVTIARKLSIMLRASNDPDLLDFARENIGAGVTRSVHMNVLRDLKVTCMLRKRAIPPGQRYAGAPITPPPPPKDLTGLSTSELLNDVIAKKKDDPERETYLREMERRRPNQGIDDLVRIASDSSNKGMQQLARDLLDRQLTHDKSQAVRKRFKDPSPEVRAAAARATGQKKWHFEADLISLLSDSEDGVRQAARKALVRLSRGQDFGPEPDAGESQRAQAARKWRNWLTQENER